MSLAYNDACPTLYQPPHFVDADQYEHSNAGPLLDHLWKQDGICVGELETSHHCIAVGVRSLKPSSSSEVQDSAISTHLKTMQRTSSSHNDGLPSTMLDSQARRSACRTPITMRSRKAKFPESRPEEAAQQDPVTGNSDGQTQS